MLLLMNLMMNVNLDEDLAALENLVEESIDNFKVFDVVNCEKDDFRVKMFCDEFVPVSTVVDILVVGENMHSSAVVVSSSNQKNGDTYVIFRNGIRLNSFVFDPGELNEFFRVKCSFDADTSGHSVDKTELEKWLFLIDHGGLKGILCNDDSPIVTNEFLRIKHSLVVDKVGHSVDKKKLEKSLVTCNECRGAIIVLERTSKRHVSGGAVVTCFRGSIIVEEIGTVFQHVDLLFVAAYWFSLENARVATKLGKEATFEIFWKLLNGLGTELAGSDLDAGNVVSTFHLIVMMLPDEDLDSLVLGSEFVRDSIVLIMPKFCPVVLFSFLSVAYL
ncbi:OLC1v1022830C1 [Oldenlandia corymbosa var. corymbosa]|uniref:OLC1v1022830C1 n=1 Tax=Oldenlandia corymbosa var. corymbosa TaxID=529605 RepID=A0AAV1C1D5_OLDCO|nr:OLC1v1022830C1 [Oldenlandia corymbosa var. corymbosa]